MKFKLTSYYGLIFSMLVSANLSFFGSSDVSAEPPTPLIQVELQRRYERPYYDNFWDIPELYRFTLMTANNATFRVERDEWDFKEYEANYDATKMKITVPNAICETTEDRPCRITAFLRDINGKKSFKSIQFDVTGPYGSTSDKWLFDEANQVIGSNYSDTFGNRYSLVVKRETFRGGISKPVQERAEYLEPGNKKTEGRIYTIHDVNGIAKERLSLVRTTWLDIDKVDILMHFAPLVSNSLVSTVYDMDISSAYFDAYNLYGVMKRDILNGLNTLRTQAYYEVTQDEDGYPRRDRIFTVYSEKSPQNSWIERFWRDNEMDEDYIVVGRPDPLVAQGSTDAPDKEIWPQDVDVPFPSERVTYRVGFNEINGHYFLVFSNRYNAYSVNYPSSDILEIFGYKFKISINDRGYVTLVRL